MSKVTEKHAGVLRHKAQELVGFQNKTILELARTLHEICYAEVELNKNQMTPLYKLWGFSSWGEWAEVDLGMHLTTASSYKRIWEVFNKLLEKCDMDLLSQVSFTRLKTISRLGKLLTASNVNAWLKKALKVSCCQLEEDIEYELTGKKVKYRHLHILVTNKQLSAIREAIDLARDADDFGTEDSGDIIAGIVDRYNVAARRKSIKLAKAS